MTYSEMVLHHIKPKSKGGHYNYENAAGRHPWCESRAHADYRDGNPGGKHDRNLVYGNRRHRRKLQHSSDLQDVQTQVEQECVGGDILATLVRTGQLVSESLADRPGLVLHRYIEHVSNRVYMVYIYDLPLPPREQEE